MTVQTSDMAARVPGGWQVLHPYANKEFCTIILIVSENRRSSSSIFRSSWLVLVV